MAHYIAIKTNIGTIEGMINLLPILLFLMSCASETNQKAWLHQQLMEDNRIWSGRLLLLEHKLTAMSLDPYDFMRGTLNLHVQESQRIQDQRLEFQSLHEEVLFFQIGDPHPENLSVSALSVPMQPFWADLDAATFGPWYWDLRRAGVGLYFFAQSLDCQCADDVIDGLFDGYFSKASQDFQWRSRILTDLMEEALEEGLLHQKYHKYTNEGAFLLDEQLDEYGKGILALNSEEEEQVYSILAKLPDSMMVLDSARRYGMGISSKPAIRYAISYLNQSTSEPGMILVREVLNPPVLWENTPYFSNNAERIQKTVEWLWSDANIDPQAQSFQVEEQDFKVLSWSSAIQDIERLKIKEQYDAANYNHQDLIDFSREMGILLYLNHIAVPTFDGSQSQKLLDEIIDDTLHRQQDKVLREMILQDTENLLWNYELLQQLLIEFGNTLGMEWMGVPS